MFVEERNLTPEQKKSAIFGIFFRLVKSVCRNGDLSMEDVYEKLLPVIGERSNPTRLYNSFATMCDNGIVPSKKFKRYFDETFINQTTLPMIAESFYDGMCYLNLRDFVMTHNFDNVDKEVYDNVLQNLDKIKDIVLKGDSFSNTMLALKSGQLVSNQEIDKEHLKEFGVNFRKDSIEARPNLWDSLYQQYGQSARSVFVQTYSKNGVDVSEQESDDSINLKCVDYMLSSLVQSSSENKDRMSINTAIKYNKNNTFSIYASDVELDF